MKENETQNQETSESFRDFDYCCMEVQWVGVTAHQEKPYDDYEWFPDR